MLARSPLQQLARAARKPRKPRAPALPPMPPLDAPAVLSISFVLDGPPAAKQRPRRAAHGAFYTPKETMAAERAVQTAAWAALARHGLMRTWPLGAYYRVTVRAFYANARRTDVDNAVKLAADAANKILWTDDSQIIDLIATRRVDREHPRTEVTVEVLV